MLTRLLRSCAFVAAALPLLAQAANVKDQPRSQFYFAIYPNFLAQYDPQSDRIVRKIPFENGMMWDVELLHDRKHFAVVTDQQRKIEIVDLEQGKVTEVHDFTKPDTIIRIRSIQEIPGGRQWYVRVDRVKKGLDRYTFDPPQTLLYDRIEKKVVRELKKLPEILSRGAHISPDGTKWLVNDQQGDLLVVDPATQKQLAKIDLTTPLFTGMGRLNVGDTDLFDGRDPKHLRMLVTLSDRVQKNRSTWGYVDIDLEQNKLSKLVEWGVGPSGWGTYVARDSHFAVSGGGGGFGGGFGGGSNRSRISLYDLTTGKKVRETFEELRPRQSLSGISPDGSKIYVGGAGSDFQIYDSATMQKIKTVNLEGEITGEIYVLEG